MLIRNLPLARLRAHNRLTEVRAGDLRFTSHEIGRFLDEVMGLSLSPADIAALDEKDDPSLQAQWLALQSTVRNTQREPMQSLTLASRALEIVPTTDHHGQSLIYLGLADAYQQLDDYAHAEAFQMIVRHGRAATNLVVEITCILPMEPARTAHRY